jgi:6-phosphogluconolactonase
MSSFVYVGTYTAGIGVFRMDAATGALAPLQLVADVECPSWLALDPGLAFLYATNEVTTWKGHPATGAVTVYAVDAATGRLTALGDRPSAGSLPAHAAVSPDGRHVLVANYLGGTFAVLPVRVDGRLGPATDVVVVTGRGPDRERQEGPHPHQVVFDPAGAFVHGPDLGTDRIWTWRLEAASGVLVPNEPADAPVAAGSGPRHLAFHPDGRFAYVVGELASTVTAFAYDGARGTFTWLQTVSTLPADHGGPNHCAEIAVHPGGAFVYASNRGHDSIAGFALDQTTGRLEPTGWTPAGGQVPRAFGIDPSGSLLLVANQGSGTIVPFEVDPETGRLTPTGHETGIATPACVQFGPAEPA